MTGDANNGMDQNVSFFYNFKPFFSFKPVKLNEISCGNIIQIFYF